ncbi:choline BCCT transporter BetT [Metapseudomonas furukawaii]|uniref:High-affinity choline uptake protein BetT n=1 Tax=Metapseudomonas furukawaii TaxID=1149133 RepID=A0AAD1FDF0_METFU|nr:choline BCCT transporter BetT [Pseudomonas furukawaii]ELS24640.1 High-affinity choline uptake protein BetT [Pseudomonas furukawaii]BAU72520.1 high-affinity choline uptake protein BetT [Pseudomonas furukawaii]
MTDTRVETDHDRLNRAVFFGSATCILALAFWALLDSDSAATALGVVLGWISEGFGWYYFLAATLYVVFVLVIALSRFGDIRMGPDHARPEFNLFTWGAMLFAAGIGIDLMFFSVAEPVTHLLQPPEGAPGTLDAARQGVAWTLFHYGITGWSMYALMGMALGYFSFRHGMPLSIRSALYPIFGRRVHGALGHGVEIAAVLGTVFGIATSLGIGVVQLNYGLKFMFDVPEGILPQALLILLSVVMATISTVSGVDKGIRRLSELNVLLAIALILFVLFSGNTVFLLNGVVLNIGDYLSGFASMTLNTFAFDRPVDWLNGWTLFFWAWWVAWAPFVGLFLARISRGRTLREFVLGTLVIPFTFTLIWISIFGNSALDVVLSGSAEFGEMAVNTPERAFYGLLAQYPWIGLSALLATLTGLLFYVTSADSGALVLGNFTSVLKDPSSDAPSWLRIFWSVVIGVLTLAMLMVGGVPTLQNATVIMGLPFSFVMFFIMAGLYRALRLEVVRRDSHQHGLAGYLSARVQPSAGDVPDWQQRVERVTTHPDREAALAMLEAVCRPALGEVCSALRRQGISARISDRNPTADGLPRLALKVPCGEAAPFRYEVRVVEAATPAYAAPGTPERCFRLEVHLPEGGQGYNLWGFSQEQVIADVLDQYERHLHVLQQVSASLPLAGR